MRRLAVWKPLAGLLMLVMLQVACGLGSAASTQNAPTPISGGAKPAPLDTQAAPTASGENAAPSDAQGMLKAAVEHYQQVGREQALKDFNERKPPFNNEALPIVCLGSDHKITAMGVFPLLAGTSVDTLKDPNGNGVGQDVWEVVAVQPEGSMPFHWKNPLTGQEESKMLYYQKLDQDVCGVAVNQQ